MYIDLIINWCEISNSPLLYCQLDLMDCDDPLIWKITLLLLLEDSKSSIVLWNNFKNMWNTPTKCTTLTNMWQIYQISYVHECLFLHSYIHTTKHNNEKDKRKNLQTQGNFDLGTENLFLVHMLSISSFYCLLLFLVGIATLKTSWIKKVVDTNRLKELHRKELATGVEIRKKMRKNYFNTIIEAQILHKWQSVQTDLWKHSINCHQFCDLGWFLPYNLKYQVRTIYTKRYHK